MANKSLSLQDKLQILLQLLTAQFPDDRLAPGVTTAYLSPTTHRTHLVPEENRKQLWYGSIARFPQGDHRLIAMAVYGDSIEDVINQLCTQTFLSEQINLTTARESAKKIEDNLQLRARLNAKLKKAIRG